MEKESLGDQYFEEKEVEVILVKLLLVQFIGKPYRVAVFLSYRFIFKGPFIINEKGKRLERGLIHFQGHRLLIEVEN